MAGLAHGRLLDVVGQLLDLAQVPEPVGRRALEVGPREIEEVRLALQAARAVLGVGDDPVPLRFCRLPHLLAKAGELAVEELEPLRPGRGGLDLELPAGWTASTALRGGPRAFQARDYDELVDAPEYQRFLRDPSSSRIPGGEPLTEACARATASIDQALTDNGLGVGDLTFGPMLQFSPITV